MRTVPNKPARLTAMSRVSQRYYRVVNRFAFLPSPFRYNLSICSEKQFLWFRVAKVCTRSILEHFEITGIHLDAAHPYQVHYSPKRYENYFRFAFVRNPWDRLVSCWLNKVVDGNLFHFDETTLVEMRQFENFVDFVSSLNVETCNAHLRLQCRLIDLNHIDCIGRFESFESDFTQICSRLDIPARTIPKKNMSNSREIYRNYYDDTLRDKASRIYSRDIQIFQYQF